MPDPGGGLGRVLGIDPGRRRVGFAVSDEARRVALGLETFEAGPRLGLVDHIRELLQAYGVTRIVLGHPRTLRGEEGEAARRSTALARRLRRELGLPVELWDECLTTVQGARLLRGERVPKGTLDRVAATLLLQNWLDRHAGEQGSGGAPEEAP